MLKVSKCNKLPMDRQPIEIVERKGKGHPDTITDGIM
ncbi:MAG: methionine adenosyltransferase, partial [Candidatus Korarchaeota archaeon]|nr:methionine adenosyltransferase [Candidatus Korarchaeota archaeon]